MPLHVDARSKCVQNEIAKIDFFQTLEENVKCIGKTVSRCFSHALSVDAYNLFHFIIHL